MKTLSIDPSTKCTGWAVFENQDLICYGAIKCEDENLPRFDRIIYMVDHLEEIIKNYDIKNIVSEAPFPMKNNAVTVLALGNLQGAILYMAHKLKLPIKFIEVATWHSAMKISKNKGDLKEQSIKFANSKYNLSLRYVSPKSVKNQSDEADAITIGAYYLGLSKNNFKKKKII